MTAMPPVSVGATTPLPVALVASETLVREGLASLLDQSPGIRCVVAAADHATALDAAETARPDVAMLDLALDVRTGLRMWRERQPTVRLLLLDDTVRDLNVQHVLRRQAAGYVTKADAFADLLDALRKCARDEPAFSPALQSRLRVGARGWELQPAASSSGLHRLTARETEVLVCLAQGFTGKECSEMLGIRPSTIDNHKSRIMQKLKVRKTVDLTRLAIREGLVPR